MTYNEQLAKENENRLIAFAGAQWPFLGGKYWARLITPRDLAALEISGNALVCGGIPTRKDLFNLLVLLLGYTGKGKLWQRFCLRRAIARMTDEQAAAEIGQYSSMIFQDRPCAASSQHEGYSADRNPAHIIAFWASFFGSHYSMSFDEIMRTPIPSLYQLRRAWLISHGRSDEVFNESDSIRAREDIEAIQKENSECQQS